MTSQKPPSILRPQTSYAGWYVMEEFEPGKFILGDDRFYRTRAQAVRAGGAMRFTATAMFYDGERWPSGAKENADVG